MSVQLCALFAFSRLENCQGEDMLAHSQGTIPISRSQERITALRKLLQNKECKIIDVRILGSNLQLVQYQPLETSRCRTPCNFITAQRYNGPEPASESCCEYMNHLPCNSITANTSISCKDARGSSCRRQCSIALGNEALDRD